MTTEYEELDAVARRVVGRYRRRSPWADHDNLMQQAWLCMLEARKGWQPELGPIGPYMETVLVRQLRRTLWRDSKPVGIPVSRSAADTMHAAGGIYAFRIVGGRVKRDGPTAAWANDGESTDYGLEDTQELAHDAVIHARQHAAMREVIENAIVRTVEDAYALAVLLDEIDAEAAAAALSTTLEEIHRAIKRARRRLSNSSEAWALTKEVVLE